MVSSNNNMVIANIQRYPYFPQNSKNSLNRILKVISSIFIVTFLVACTSVQNPIKTPATLTDKTAKSYDVFVDEFPEVEASSLLRYAYQDVFKVGDTANISVFDVENLSGSHIVDRAGDVSFPLIGKIKVAGMNTLELQAELVDRYGEKYLQNPSISVRLDAQKLGRIVVDGAVNKPGVFDVFKTVSLSEAIALAGGLDRDADSKSIYLIREFKSGRKIITVNLNLIRTEGAIDPKIFPNDIVFVQESGTKVAFREFLRTLPLVNTIFILAR